MIKEPYKIKAALYSRLSRDDASAGESNSIQNQKTILEDFCEKNGITNFTNYVDDGYSGTDFERPGFVQMMSDAKSGKINTIIVKDHSRLGRDRLKVGYLLEQEFVELGIRYITADNFIDTANGLPEGLAFMDVYNEYHVFITSKKVNHTFDKMRENGISLRSRAPYGYQKDPNDKHKLIPNEETKDTVIFIFEMFASGAKIVDIAKELKNRRILSPSAYDNKRLGRQISETAASDPYYWDYSTLKDMLDNEAYIGTTIMGTSRKPFYKAKKSIYIPREQWLRFPNDHEAIISPELWSTVQQRRATKQRHSKSGEKDIFAGKLICADCGRVMHIGTGSYICGTYKKYYYRDEDGCTPHNISRKVLDEVALKAIQSITTEVKKGREEFIRIATEASEKDINKEIIKAEKALAKAQKRLAELDKYLMSVYEDKVKGEISAEQFAILSTNYSKEKAEQEKISEDAVSKIADLKNKTVNVKEFIKIVDKYTEITELNLEILNAFVEKIVIHERSEPHRRKGFSQEIDIYFNFIGKLGGE